LSTILVIFAILFSYQSHALVPVESLIFGDLSEYYKSERVDPIGYVFSISKNLENEASSERLEQLKKNLALYRGFYQEGQNLENYCRRQPEFSYSTRFEQDQVIRSVLASIQYISLDLSTRALAQYAKELNFTPSEYQNMVDSLTGQYCSKNISIISLRQLKLSMMQQFQKEEKFPLPNLDNNTLFPDEFSLLVSGRAALEKQMIQTLRIFKTACSWGGETDNRRLMPSLVRDPALMAFFIRQLSSRRLNWQQNDNLIIAQDDPDAKQVHCENLICRRVSQETFNRELPRQVGSINIADDLRKLYCSDFRDSDYQTRNQVPELLEIIRTSTFDDQNFLVGHYIALLSGIPDLLLHVDQFEDFKPLARASFDRIWNRWAQDQLSRHQKNLHYEEVVSIEVVDRTRYYFATRPRFKVVLDINLGEFDRLTQRHGKISSQFDVKISHAFFIWARKQWFSDGADLSKRREEVIERLQKKLEPQFNQARDYFRVPPWTQPIESLAAREIAQQIGLQAQDSFFTQGASPAMVTIPIEINFGLFALRYMRYRHQINQNQERERRFRQTHEDFKKEGLGYSNP
jgi:hypothetical protein